MGVGNETVLPNKGRQLSGPGFGHGLGVGNELVFYSLQNPDPFSLGFWRFLERNSGKRMGKVPRFRGFPNKGHQLNSEGPGFKKNPFGCWEASAGFGDFLKGKNPLEGRFSLAALLAA